MDTSMSLDLTDSPAARRAAPPGDGHGPRMAVRVHRARLVDLSGLLRVQQQVPLNLPYTHPERAHPVRAVLGGLVPFARHSRRVFVARNDHRLVGFALFREASLDQRWELESLGSQTGLFDADPVWEELLRYSIVAAGLEGVRRLYARVPTGSPVLAAMRRMGFFPYASEQIYASANAQPQAISPSVRPQVPSDLWGIHQLYVAVVPKQVQYAEALSSACWSIPGGRRLGQPRRRGWVLETREGIVGYGRVVSTTDAHVVRLIVDPAHREVARDIVATIMASLANRPPASIFCELHGYESELGTTLRQLGFEAYLEQDLHVKYTVVPSRIAASHQPAFADLSAEPVASRVPTFLQEFPPERNPESAL